MVQVKVKEIVLCLLVVLSSCTSSSLKSFDRILTEETTETQDLPPAIDEDFVETPEDSILADDPLANLKPIDQEETLPAEIELKGGKLFRLRMTVAAEWSDEFDDKTSAAFNNLATELGAELKTFVEKKLEVNETEFKLIEVQPIKASSEAIYVTFLVSSVTELNGEDFSNAISNQINLYEAIEKFKVMTNDFAVENVTEEDLHNSLKNEEVEEQMSGSAETTTEFLQPEENTTELPQSESLLEDSENGAELPHSTCHLEKIQQRGSTSIYIMQAHPQCDDEVRNSVHKEGNAPHEEVDNDEGTQGDESYDQCSRNFKRSAKEDLEDETVVVIKKRGNQVFIEI